MTRYSGGLEASVLLHAASNVVLMLPPIMAGNTKYLEELTKEGPGFTMAALATANVLVATWLTLRSARTDGEEKERKGE
jgi:hypothetical protein